MMALMSKVREHHIRYLAINLIGIPSLTIVIHTCLTVSPLPHTLLFHFQQGLGYGILAGSTFVKVPQILNISRSHSARGLSAFSHELQVLVLSIGASYGFIHHLPFSAYGEAVALLLQTSIILLLIYHYQDKSTSRLVFVTALLAAWVAATVSNQISISQITRAYDVTIFILIIAQAQQIYQCYKDGSAGQLSGITYTMNTAGAAARIFTSIQENAGASMMRGYAVSLILNAIILGQIVVYGSKEKTKGGISKKKTMNGKNTSSTERRRSQRVKGE